MKIKYILFLMTAMLAFASCSDDTDPKVSSEPKAPIFDKLSVTDFTITNKSDMSEVADVWKWQAADYGVATQITYVIQADLADADFSSPAVVSTVTTDTAAITLGMLNKAALKFTQKAEPITLKVRVASTISNKIDTIYSETQTIVVTPYPAYPEHIYMVGAEFGKWDWGSKGVVEFIPVNGKEGVFWTINYFSENQGFKLSPVKDWAGSFGKLGDKDSGFSNDKDGNIIVTKTGLYLIYADMIGNQLTVEPALVYGIGDAFGGWDSNKFPFVVNPDGKTMSIKTTASGELRIYAGTTVKGATDWWTREFMIFDNQIVYRGNGGDQDRVNVSAGQTITLDFRAGTGSIANK